MEQNVNKRNMPARGLVFFAQLCVLAAFVCFFAYLVLPQLASAQEVDKQIAAVEAEIAEQEAAQAALLLETDYLGSDSFIEKMAREQLNMIRKDEIVFVITR